MASTTLDIKHVSNLVAISDTYHDFLTSQDKSGCPFGMCQSRGGAIAKKDKTKTTAPLKVQRTIVKTKATHKKPKATSNDRCDQEIEQIYENLMTSDELKSTRDYFQTAPITDPSLKAVIEYIMKPDSKSKQEVRKYTNKYDLPFTSTDPYVLKVIANKEKNMTYEDSVLSFVNSLAQNGMIGKEYKVDYGSMKTGHILDIDKVNTSQDIHNELVNFFSNGRRVTKIGIFTDCFKSSPKFNGIFDELATVKEPVHGIYNLNGIAMKIDRAAKPPKARLDATVVVGKEEPDSHSVPNLFGMQSEMEFDTNDNYVVWQTSDAGSGSHSQGEGVKLQQSQMKDLLISVRELCIPLSNAKSKLADLALTDDLKNELGESFQPASVYEKNLILHDIKRSLDYGQVAFVKALNGYTQKSTGYDMRLYSYSIKRSRKATAEDEDDGDVDIEKAVTVNISNFDLFIVLTFDRLCYQRCVLEGVPSIYVKDDTKLLMSKPTVQQLTREVMEAELLAHKTSHFYKDVFLSGEALDIKTRSLLESKASKLKAYFRDIMKLYYARWMKEFPVLKFKNTDKNIYHHSFRTSTTYNEVFENLNLSFVRFALISSLSIKEAYEKIEAKFNSLLDQVRLAELFKAYEEVDQVGRMNLTDDDIEAIYDSVKKCNIFHSVNSVLSLDIPTLDPSHETNLDNMLASLLPFYSQMNTLESESQLKMMSDKNLALVKISRANKMLYGKSMKDIFGKHFAISGEHLDDTMDNIYQLHVLTLVLLNKIYGFDYNKSQVESLIDNSPQSNNIFITMNRSPKNKLSELFNIPFTDTTKLEFIQFKTFYGEDYGKIMSWMNFLDVKGITDISSLFKNVGHIQTNLQTKNNGNILQVLFAKIYMNGFVNGAYTDLTSSRDFNLNAVINVSNKYVLNKLDTMPNFLIDRQRFEDTIQEHKQEAQMMNVITSTIEDYKKSVTKLVNTKIQHTNPSTGAVQQLNYATLLHEVMRTKMLLHIVAKMGESLKLVDTRGKRTREGQVNSKIYVAQTNLLAYLESLERVKGLNIVENLLNEVYGYKSALDSKLKGISVENNTYIEFLLHELHSKFEAGHTYIDLFDMTSITMLTEDTIDMVAPILLEFGEETKKTLDMFRMFTKLANIVQGYEDHFPVFKSLYFDKIYIALTNNDIQECDEYVDKLLTYYRVINKANPYTTMDIDIRGNFIKIDDILNYSPATKKVRVGGASGRNTNNDPEFDKLAAQSHYPQEHKKILEILDATDNIDVYQAVVNEMSANIPLMEQELLTKHPGLSTKEVKSMIYETFLQELVANVKSKYLPMVSRVLFEAVGEYEIEVADEMVLNDEDTLLEFVKHYYVRNTTDNENIRNNIVVTLDDAEVVLRTMRDDHSDVVDALDVISKFKAKLEHTTDGLEAFETEVNDFLYELYSNEVLFGNGETEDFAYTIHKRYDLMGKRDFLKLILGMYESDNEPKNVEDVMQPLLCLLDLINGIQVVNENGGERSTSIVDLGYADFHTGEDEMGFENSNASNDYGTQQQYTMYAEDKTVKPNNDDENGDDDAGDNANVQRGGNATTTSTQTTQHTTHTTMNLMISWMNNNFDTVIKCASMCIVYGCILGVFYRQNKEQNEEKNKTWNIRVLLYTVVLATISWIIFAFVLDNELLEIASNVLYFGLMGYVALTVFARTSSQ